jgi:ATP-dependent DNA helicase RecQ
VLRLTDKSPDVLFHGEIVTMPVKKQPDSGESVAPGRRPRRDTGLAAPEEDGLLSALRALRTALAQAAGVPAYIIFSNAALDDMAAIKPRTMAAFLSISGVGKVKAERYGRAFLKTIADYDSGRFKP